MKKITLKPVGVIMPPVDPEELAKELLDRYVESEISFHNHMRFRDRPEPSCSTCQQRRDRLRAAVIEAMTTGRP